MVGKFFHHSIYLAGKEWKSVEHYYQAQKFAGTELEEAIRSASSAAEAKEISRFNRNKRVKNWNSVKLDVMYKALRAKFTQHEDLKKLLLSTGEEHVVEKTTDDSFWGSGFSGEGRNMIGILLMRLRKELMDKENGKK